MIEYSARLIIYVTSSRKVSTCLVVQYWPQLVLVVFSTQWMVLAIETADLSLLKATQVYSILQSTRVFSLKYVQKHKVHGCLYIVNIFQMYREIKQPGWLRLPIVVWLLIGKLFNTEKVSHCLRCPLFQFLIYKWPYSGNGLIFYHVVMMFSNYV